jgi:hypothetical protein
MLAPHLSQCPPRSDLRAQLEENGVPPNLDQEASWDSLPGGAPAAADGSLSQRSPQVAAADVVQPDLAPINTGSNGSSSNGSNSSAQLQQQLLPGEASGKASATATPRSAAATPRSALLAGSTLTPRGAGVIASAAALSSSIARKGVSATGSGGGRMASGEGAAAAGAAAGSADAAVEALAAALPLRLGGMLRASQQERKGVSASRLGTSFAAAVADDLAETCSAPLPETPTSSSSPLPCQN